MDEQNLPNICNYLSKNESGHLRLKKRHAYYAQVQLGMAVLKLARTDFIIYSSATDNYFVIPVNFDLEFSTVLIQTVTKKFFEHMLHVYCENKDEI